jgi:hypothetical protein
VKKAAAVLKACAIILNSLLAIFLTLVLIQIQSSGLWLIMMSAVVFCAILNVIILALSKRLLAGAIGVFFLYLSSILNLCSLFGVVAGLVKWGLPEEPVAAMAVIIWFAFPIITIPAIFFVRRQLNKNDDSGCNSITCPNRNTEISTN